jgi:Asp-tRNA(Asn)/Glu-tRNA(Gln) amidotransferase A subunit family amidase
MPETQAALARCADPLREAGADVEELVLDEDFGSHPNGLSVGLTLTGPRFSDRQIIVIAALLGRLLPRPAIPPDAVPSAATNLKQLDA